MSGILEGIRVLDLGRIISAPYCTMLMGDLGAEVIKVEKAGTGDEMRTMSEFDYPTVNRNKKSVTLQFRSDEGKELLRKLIEKSDVIVENFRPGTMAKMGFSYEEVKKINPRIIMASISGYGQTGPYRERAAFDSIIQASSGIMSVIGNKEIGPVRMGAPILDHLTGVFALSGIVLALYERESTGEGRYIDIGMMDAAVPMLFTHIPDYSAYGIVAATEDQNVPTAVPAKTYKAKDGYIYINGGTPRLFLMIREVLGIEELMDEKYESQAYRQEHYKEVNALVAEWVAQRTVDEVNDIMTEHGIPSGIVASVDRVVSDPHVLYREDVVEIEVEGHGKVKFGGNPIKISGRPVEKYEPGHALGQDNADVYKGLLGFTDDELEALRKKNVI